MNMSCEVFSKEDRSRLLYIISLSFTFWRSFCSNLITLTQCKQETVSWIRLEDQLKVTSLTQLHPALTYDLYLDEEKMNVCRCKCKFTKLSLSLLSQTDSRKSSSQSGVCPWHCFLWLGARLLTCLLHLTDLHTCIWSQCSRMERAFHYYLLFFILDRIFGIYEVRAQQPTAVKQATQWRSVKTDPLKVTLLN